MEYGPRNINTGNEFDSYFPKAKGNTIKRGNRSIEYNVENIVPKIVQQNSYQTKKIADYLFDSDRETFCHNIWDFAFNNFQYEFDAPGKEQFRTPARSYADRITPGIDCDCFSILISSILSNKKIPHCLRITKYDNEPSWKHIYIVVPRAGMSFNPYEPETYIVIDAVIHSFNKEKSFTDQKTYLMNNGLGVVTEVLNGFNSPGGINIEETETDIISGVINGFDSETETESSYLEDVKKHLIATRNWVMRNPSLFEDQGGDAAAFIKMSEYAIDNFDDEKTRTQAFEVLAENEDRYNKFVLDLDQSEIDNDLEGLYDYDLAGLGRTRAERKAAQAARKANRSSKKTVRSTKRSDKKVERKEERGERKAERQDAQGFFKKVGVAIKQGSKATIVKYNPAVIAARQGFLMAIKFNLFRLATRMSYAVVQPRERISQDKLNASKAIYAKINQLFDKKLQGSESALKAAIKIGMLKKGQDLKGLVDSFAGLGDPVLVASVLTAVPVLVSAINSVLSVESQYGVSGLGMIDDDVFETELILNDLDEYISGLGKTGTAPTKVDAAMLIAFIKKVLGKVKANRDAKKGMTKEQRKNYNKSKRSERKTGGGSSAASKFSDNFKKSTGNDPIDDESEDVVEFDERSANVDDDGGSEDQSYFQKHKKHILYAIGGIGLVAGSVAAYKFYSKKKKKTPSKAKSLKGLKGKKMKVFKAKV